MANPFLSGALNKFGAAAGAIKNALNPAQLGFNLGTKALQPNLAQPAQPVDQALSAQLTSRNISPSAASTNTAGQPKVDQTLLNQVIRRTGSAVPAGITGSTNPAAAVSTATRGAAGPTAPATANVTLPNGQVVDKNDPNIATYTKQAQDAANANNKTPEPGPVAPPTPDAPPTLPPPPAPNPLADAQKKYLESFNISPDQTSVEQQIADLYGSSLAGQTGLEGQGRGIPLSIVRGQQAVLEKQAANKAAPLQLRLEQLIANRQTAKDKAAAELGFANTDATNAASSNKPIEIGGSLVKLNPTTGKYEAVYSEPKAAAEKKYAPGAAGEYQFYAENETAAGRKPVSFNDYQNMDANRKARAAGGGAGSGGGANSQYLDIAKAIVENPGLKKNYTNTELGKITNAAIAAHFSPQEISTLGLSLSDSAINKLTQSQTSIDALNALKDVFAENQKYIGPIAGLQAYNPFSGARTVQAKIDLVRQRVGKALEGGVLRKEDEEKYKKVLANITDTDANATAKIDNLIIDVQRDMDNYSGLQAATGRYVPPSAANKSSGSSGMEQFIQKGQ